MAWPMFIQVFFGFLDPSLCLSDQLVNLGRKALLGPGTHTFKKVTFRIDDCTGNPGFVGNDSQDFIGSKILPKLTVTRDSKADAMWPSHLQKANKSCGRIGQIFRCRFQAGSVAVLMIFFHHVDYRRDGMPCAFKVQEFKPCAHSPHLSAVLRALARPARKMSTAKYAKDGAASSHENQYIWVVSLTT